MKKIFLLAIVVLGTVQAGCDEKGTSYQETMYVCDCEQQKSLQRFMSEGIKPANNMSDEEMEDVISELRVSGVKVFCQQMPVYVKRTSGGGTEIDWAKEGKDSCKFIMNHW